MPVYEFYCSACNTLFSFFSSRIDTTARPACPRCARPELERRPARFSTLKHTGDDEPDPLDELDETRMAGAMESLADELAGAEDEEDPRQLGRLMRRFGAASGLSLGPRMEEMVRRLEAGEDPDDVEEEMGDDLGEEGEGLDELFQFKKAVARRRRRPRVDQTLYFM